MIFLFLMVLWVFHGFVSWIDVLEEGIVVGVASVSGIVMVSYIIVLWSIVSSRSVVCIWV